MLNFHIPGDSLPFGTLARNAERIRARDKALETERSNNDGLTKMLAEEKEKVRVLEAKLTTARAELLKALHGNKLHEARDKDK